MTYTSENKISYFSTINLLKHSCKRLSKRKKTDTYSYNY